MLFLFRSVVACLAIVLASLTTSATQADTFGSGLNLFGIEFVTIGNPDNPDDTTGDPNPAGKVDYTYRMGKYEISRDMITKANNEGGLGITIDSMSYVIGGPRDDMPAIGVSWFEAATFVNWLNTSTGHTPAYKFDGNGNFQLWQSGDAGYNPANLFRNSQAFYFLPSTDEWYKAAYYNGTAGVYYNYPTGSDTVPTPVISGTTPDTAVFGQSSSQGPADISLAGGLSPYGTMGQGGNVWEWEETDVDLFNDSSSSDRGLRGGDWINVSFGMHSSLRVSDAPTLENSTVGFRVASIPEPSTLLLAALAIVGLFTARCKRR